MQTQGDLNRPWIPARWEGSPTPLGITRPRRTAFWAPCLSALCFVHCAGMALLAPLVPALAAFEEIPWLEWVLFALSAASTAWVLWRLRPGQLAWIGGAACMGLVSWGFLNEREGAKQLGFLTLALVQGAIVFASRRKRVHQGCCESGELTS